jgi:hypothetical protein
MPITVNFRSLGESATYPDGTDEQTIHDDYQRRQFRSGYGNNPITSIMGLVEHITSKPTAPTPATVDGSSVIGLAPDQTTALLDRVQRTNEVQQQAYQAQVDRAARAKELEANRMFSAQQQQQQQDFQVQQQEAQVQREDQKDKQNKVEGTVKPNAQGGYDWIRNDPATGQPIVSQLQPGSNEWKTINIPGGGISQVEVDPTGKILGTPQQIVAPEADKVNWQRVTEPALLPDGRYGASFVNPQTLKPEFVELPKPAPKVNADDIRIERDANGKPFIYNKTTNTWTPAAIPPDFAIKTAKDAGFTEEDYSKEWAAVVNEEFGMEAKPEEHPAIDARVRQRLIARKSAVNQMNAPLGTPPNAPAQGGTIFTGKDGKRYRDLGNGTAEEL